MRLTLSEDPDERAADLMALGGLLAYLHVGEPKPMTEGWLHFLLNVYDAVTQDVGADEFTFSFRRAVRDAMGGAKG